MGVGPVHGRDYMNGSDTVIVVDSHDGQKSKVY